MIENGITSLEGDCKMKDDKNKLIKMINFLFIRIQSAVKDIWDLLCNHYIFFIGCFNIFLVFGIKILNNDFISFEDGLICIVTLTSWIINGAIQYFKFEELNLPKLKKRYTKKRVDGEVYIDIKEFQLAVLALYTFEEFAERNGFYKNGEND